VRRGALQGFGPGGGGALVRSYKTMKP
jgi:hypothetical protein